MNTLEPRLILVDAFRFFRASLPDLIILFIPLLLIASLGELFFLSSSEGNKQLPVSWMIGLLFKPFYTAVLILYIQSKSSGTPLNYKSLLAKAIILWLPVFIVSFSVAILVVFGLYAYIIPGVWIAVRLALSEYFVIVKGLSTLEAMRESYHWSEGNFWPLLAVLLVAIVPVIVFGKLVNALLNPAKQNVILGILSQTLVSFAGLFSIIVLYRVFMLLTEEKTGSSKE